MDINMPVMNGIQAASLIKKAWSEAVIIGLRVIQDTYATSAFLKAGAVAVISKDRIDDIYTAIQRGCEIEVTTAPAHRKQRMMER
jgi:DNA-binding NarL/FixJ family response regulator